MLEKAKSMSTDGNRNNGPSHTPIYNRCGNAKAKGIKLFFHQYAGRNIDKDLLVIYILHYEGGAIMAESNRPSGVPADLGAYLGAGTKINGKLHFEGQATIDGEVDGEIVAQGHITVGQQAIVKGKVSAQSILVQGKVMADVVAEKKLEIQPPGSVVGDVTTISLVIGDGAILEGHISMKKNEARVLPIRQDVKKEGTL